MDNKVLELLELNLKALKKVNPLLYGLCLLHLFCDPVSHRFLSGRSTISFKMLYFWSHSFIIFCDSDGGGMFCQKKPGTKR